MKLNSVSRLTAGRTCLRRLVLALRRLCAPWWVKQLARAHSGKSSKPIPSQYIHEMNVEPFASGIIRGILRGLPPSSLKCRFRSQPGGPYRDQSKADKTRPSLEILDDSILDLQDEYDDQMEKFLSSRKGDTGFHREVHSILLSWGFDPPELRRLALRGRRFSFLCENTEGLASPADNATPKP